MQLIPLILLWTLVEAGVSIPASLPERTTLLIESSVELSNNFTPSVELSTPRVELSTHKVELYTPSVELSIPGVELSTPFKDPLDKQIMERLLKVHSKYHGQEYWKYNDEFALMFERVEEAITLDNGEVDKKIDVLEEFETFDAARIELDRRIYVTIAKIDQKLTEKDMPCVEKFEKMKKVLIKALNKANKTKSKKLSQARLRCN